MLKYVLYSYAHSVRVMWLFKTKWSGATRRTVFEDLAWWCHERGKRACGRRFRWWDHQATVARTGGVRGLIQSPTVPASGLSSTDFQKRTRHRGGRTGNALKRLGAWLEAKKERLNMQLLRILREVSYDDKITKLADLQKHYLKQPKNAWRRRFG